jgi:nucleotide-binding universal stress UspA family protein
MTHASIQTAPRLTWETASQEGPVLLATKPFHGLDAPLAVARWLATREERELHVVTVLEQGDALGMAAGMPPLPQGYYDEERLALAEQIREDLSLDGSGADLPHVAVLEGSNARAIVGAARKCGARVIVIGTGRHDTIGRLVHGEGALQILSITDRPVLIVPRDARPGPVAVAVVAVDFSPASLRAARAALPMLSEGSRLVLVHVKPTVASKKEMPSWSDEPYEQRSLRQFNQFLRQLPTLPGVVVETKVLQGDASRTIIEYARMYDAGLIACGRLGHSFVERVLVGSVSTALVRHATCPVLVAPELPGDLVE